MGGIFGMKLVWGGMDHIQIKNKQEICYTNIVKKFWRMIYIGQVVNKKGGFYSKLYWWESKNGRLDKRFCSRL